jgi:hypothetical protein
MKTVAAQEVCCATIQAGGDVALRNPDTSDDNRSPLLLPCQHSRRMTDRLQWGFNRQGKSSTGLWDIIASGPGRMWMVDGPDFPDFLELYLL